MVRKSWNESFNRVGYWDVMAFEAREDVGGIRKESAHWIC